LDALSSVILAITVSFLQFSVFGECEYYVSAAKNNLVAVAHVLVWLPFAGIQIFTPDYKFLHSIGTWGCGDAEFKGMEGLAVTGNGKILVVDREQHCVKCF
jgi:amino acid permease